MDLFDFIDLASSSKDIEEDETYNKIISNWSRFIDCLQCKDRHLLLELVSKSYFKYQKPIKVYGLSDFELYIALLMSILIEQQIQIDGIKHNSASSN